MHKVNFQLWCDVYQKYLQELYRIFQSYTYRLLPIQSFLLETNRCFIFFCKELYIQSSNSIHHLDISEFYQTVENNMIYPQFNQQVNEDDLTFIFISNNSDNSDVDEYYQQNVLDDMIKEMLEYSDRYKVNILNNLDMNRWDDFIDHIRIHFSR